jgi:leucyl aminopeptidase
MMQITLKTQSPSKLAVDLLAVPLFRLDPDKRALPRSIASLDKSLGGCIEAVVSQGDFRGNANEALLVYPQSGCAQKRVLLLGLGKEETLDNERLRGIAGRSVQGAVLRGAPKVALLVPSTRRIPVSDVAQSLAEGATLGGYRFDTYRKKKQDSPTKPIKSLALLYARLAKPGDARKGLSRGIILGESQNLARTLSNEPGNAMPPAALAQAAVKMAREVGLKSHVMNPAELKRRKMGAILAVGQGSANPPRLIVLEHKPAGRGKARSKPPTLCLVGKGITFDSGGISIKPSPNMGDMKHDMGGAAAVVGAMRAVKLLDLPLHVVGIVAAAENMPSGAAYRPGDIITTHSGKTVEVGNTDAEGRLVLADALSHAIETYSPAAMVDLATLTGACMVALGRFASGLMGNNDALVDQMRQAGIRSGEIAWPLPLFDGHKKTMQGTISDLVNVAGREAGASTAGGFLAAFVDDTPWLHLDIAGTAWTTKMGPYQGRGATGVGVRLLLDFLEHWEP